MKQHITTSVVKVNKNVTCAACVCIDLIELVGGIGLLVVFFPFQLHFCLIFCRKPNYRKFSDTTAHMSGSGYLEIVNRRCSVLL